METQRYSFNHWVRTGRLILFDARWGRREVKFNPNHDPKTGRFTFKDGAGLSESDRPKMQAGKEDPRIAAMEQQARAKAKAADPRNPANWTYYKVQPRDTLQHIAATRVGIGPDDLEWLNGLPDDKIEAGQMIKLPTQASLDAAKQRFDTVVALSNYTDAHGGALPPDVAHPPSLQQQQFGSGTHVKQANGYNFTLDSDTRSRQIDGTIALSPDQARSRAAQAAAGGEDRLPTDQGGHYIARQFGGPADDINHFAQDQNFNQSAYAKMENDWKKATEAGEKVHVTITPTYAGASKRPSEIDVIYSIGGIKYQRTFPNAKGARYDRR